MKFNKIILPVVAGTLILGSCDDNKMEWGTPDDHGKVEISDIPLALKEKLANYKMIKEYVREYTPGMTIGLGLGADLYISDELYRQVADENFQMFTCGNAMKHSSVVQNNGSLNFTTIDNFLNAVPADIEVYGHNFIWHTQQKQAYLKSLIAPEVVIQNDTSGNIENVIANSDFEAGHTSGWGAWSSAGCTQNISDAGEGYESTYAIKLYNPAAGANYSAQAFYTLPTMTYNVGDIYILSFYVMADHVDESFQAQLQNRTTYSAQKYMAFPITAAGQWLYCEAEIEMTQAIIDSAFDHVTFDFGAETGYVYLDNVQFGKKIDGPANYVSNGSFEKDLEDWNIVNGKDAVAVVELADAIDGSHALSMTANESMSNIYDLQIECAKMPTLPGKMVQLSFWVKSDQTGAGTVYFSSDMSNQWPWLPWYPGASSWTGTFETSTSWQQVSVVLQKYSVDFNEGATTWNFNLNFGSIPGVTYYIDDVQVVEYEEGAAASSKRLTRSATTRATTITYVSKSAEEKKAILLSAMEEWIKGMAEHIGDRVKAWDVINEPISDNIQWRGIEGKGFMDDDTAPTENAEEGLNLNWADDHFYWGYYIGKEYATKAFEYARKYTAPGAKLFVNDYNLETSPNKLAALIDFVKYIDENNGTGAPIVDGIGTQMHVSSSITQAQVDAMFQTMAATGKLVRVTELDVQLGTASPSADQLETQANVYRMIIESYKANVPEAQQSGITIWGLTDNANEHEYWLPNDAPNLFDANYGRKHAYKGVCDGIAGRDISEDFTGDLWDTGLTE